MKKTLITGVTGQVNNMTDSSNLIRIIQQTQSDEVCNLAIEPHAAKTLGALRTFELIWILRLENKTRFYQTSTSRDRITKAYRSPRLKRLIKA